MTTPKKRVNRTLKHKQRHRGINVIDPQSERSRFEQINISNIKQSRTVELEILIDNEWRRFQTSFAKAKRLIHFTHHRGYLITPI
ncbi:hypothetical protein ACPV5O_26810 [Vibrio maritimus]|uniref:hypothetical protein n=1 Tax=Vibrio maritimus TaxID=990268 RepID=UPI004067D485